MIGDALPCGVALYFASPRICINSPDNHAIPMYTQKDSFLYTSHVDTSEGYVQLNFT